MSRAPVQSIDAVIGQRLRNLRNELKISQGKLGEDVGISFQQVQKYERGANRISASRLFLIAKALNVSVDYFYQGFRNVQEDMAAGLAEDAVPYTPPSSDAEAEALLSAFARIKSPALRASVVSMARTLADNQADVAG